ncbi:hypothetical protein GGX14DRAFT_565367 [Mycena pura]|uniref:Uncharacterized protein n=1 Tax=Mycena pura TaxID=153505 RepID=A0AAD6VIR0_9AGAR|nr:hypothetical protein GGX14DRAFT_565367 [Mycena pura]
MSVFDLPAAAALAEFASSCRTRAVRARPHVRAGVSRARAALGGMPALVGLDLWVLVEPDLNAYRFFIGDLRAAAPGLEDFQFTCTPVFGKRAQKPLNALAYALCEFPRLKSFAGHHARVPRGALLWSRARAACRNHLKQGAPHMPACAWIDQGHEHQTEACHFWHVAPL